MNSTKPATLTLKLIFVKAMSKRVKAEGRQTSPSWRRGRKRDGPAAPLPPSHPPPGIPPPAKVPYSSWREGPLLGGGFVFKEHAEGPGLACHQSGSNLSSPRNFKTLAGRRPGSARVPGASA